jgi:hypothetical protein
VAPASSLPPTCSSSTPGSRLLKVTVEYDPGDEELAESIEEMKTNLGLTDEELYTTGVAAVAKARIKQLVAAGHGPGSEPWG